MTKPNDHSSHAAPHSPAAGEEQDSLKALMPIIPIVLPIVGGVLMFLLAFIAIYMA